MEIIRIDVLKERKSGGVVYPYFYICQATPDGWKCGKCLKGWIEPIKGFKCAVCSAVVKKVYKDRPEYHRRFKTCGMCQQELNEDEDMNLHRKLDCTRGITPSISQRLDEIETMLKKLLNN